MPEPRLSSGTRHLSSFQTESKRNPNGFPTHKGSARNPGTGTGSGTGSKDYLAAARRSSEQLARAVAWAKNNLPNESRTWAVGAFFAERAMLGREPSSAEVMARLKATGRDSGSLDPAVLAAEQQWCEARGV